MTAAHHLAPDLPVLALDGLLPALPLLPVLAGALLAGAAGWPALAPLYRRLTRASLLLQDERLRTLDYFRAHPGATVGEAAAALGVDYKTTLHHARVLAEFRLLRGAKDGRRTLYEAVPPPP